MPTPLLSSLGLVALLATAPATPDNPLLRPWTGPYGGVPPFDQVKVEQFQPAIEAAMAEALAEIDAIANDPAPPTFENTIVAKEKTGRTLDRVMAVFGVYGSTMSTPEFQAVELEVSPKLAAFGDRIIQNEKLFARIAAVYAGRDEAALTPEQNRLVWLEYTRFVHAGAQLGAEAKERLSAINQRLATLYTQFSQNVLADETDHLLVLAEKDLAGLPDSYRAGAAVAAEASGHPGKWVVLNTRSSMEPFLTFSERRDLREKVWRTYYSRGDNGDAKDNKAIITEILALRAERAKLLGYATHAHWRLEDTMAKTPERAMALLEAVWTPAVARAHEEIADMQAVADAEGAGIRIEPWDYRFYAEKVRKAKYDIDENLVKPYLQLEQLREGMFQVATDVFGLRFAPVAGLPVVHPDVRVWEVTDAASGRHVGLWYWDPYARTGKQSGAWMSEYRSQHRFDGEVTPIVSNNSNFVKGTPGAPVLISWDDATTLFHEFGHALHGLSSNVAYPSLAGTEVALDFVEFPSQILEHWLPVPEILQRYARHYETGEPIPAALVARLERAANFNQGFQTVEYLASAIVDMKLHLAGAAKIDPDAFERETLAAIGMPREIVMRHRTPQFGHIFSGDGYSAGYYSYLWADTLTADAWEAFTAGAGPWDKQVAKRLREHVFSVGNTVDPAETYRAFRGRDAGIEALMRKRGFPVPTAPTAAK
ncbi:MAG TPA: M3 family metallopeptidase [Thermoanaerobaculia bacterium]|nr:M3 family metallopeptidase [Thermoanaerobaculia bacterium]MDI9632344.1 M3 family metallopeptidase [Acidobacteriota bacterium]OQC41075.1 MAG: Peptidyl-dipeptidase dcp [Acidobacteria bacterium ADurb.Bin051]MBP7813754.1 M3 family metallopeptidase [Thermoanaerobaculia bacterium]MBP8845639.1 M3 family metallopeptidase [Thermoanaerobaculia bacterium]